MSGVDEILSYKKNPDEDFYALLNCDENSSVSFWDARTSELFANGWLSGKFRNLLIAYKP